MKKTYGIPALCILLFLLLAGPALAEPVSGCDRAADETSRLETARSMLTVNVSNYETVINYWAEDVTYKEPLFINDGRDEMYEYLQAMYGGTIYGYPDDKVLEIRDEVYKTYPDGSMTYIATVQWSGTFGVEYYFQTGMSIIKFQPGEGCPSYHRDYYSEGDNWFNTPGKAKSSIIMIRNLYVNVFKLTDRCFDEDGDGYTKYASATGCPQGTNLDCNDFVPGIHPFAGEIPGNGIDDDCNAFTLDGGVSCFIGTMAF